MHQWDIEINGITWIYRDPEGNEGKVADSKAEETIGLKKDDKFKEYISDWFCENSSMVDGIPHGYREWASTHWN